MTKYSYLPYTNEDGVVRAILRSDGASIPIDEGNTDYQRYLRWLENPDADDTQGGIN